MNPAQFYSDGAQTNLQPGFVATNPVLSGVTFTNTATNTAAFTIVQTNGGIIWYVVATTNGLVVSNSAYTLPGGGLLVIRTNGELDYLSTMGLKGAVTFSNSVSFTSTLLQQAGNWDINNTVPNGFFTKAGIQAGAGNFVIDATGNVTEPTMSIGAGAVTGGATGVTNGQQFYNSNSAVSCPLSYNLYGSTNIFLRTNSTAEFDLLPGTNGFGTTNLPANWWTAGKQVHVSIRLYGWTGGNGNTLKIYVGTNSLLTNASLGAITTTRPILIDYDIRCDTAGASGKFEVSGLAIWMAANTTGLISYELDNVYPNYQSTVDTTQATSIKATWTMGGTSGYSFLENFAKVRVDN